MTGPELTVKKTSRAVEIRLNIRALARRDVLVGWTEAANTRDDGAPIGNAALAFIHTHGSQLKGIPARPILQPAITEPSNRAQIGQQLGIAASAVLQGNEVVAQRELEKTGMLAQNIVKRWFVSPLNHWAPNSPYTIARKGSARPLIDKGILRRSVTYIVR